MRFWRRKKNEPVSQGSGLTRRALFRWGFAAAALGGVAYVTGKTLKSIGKAHAEYERKFFEAVNRKPISTREKGVRGIIESTPEIVEKEMSWYKPGPGQLREGHLNRYEQGVDSVFPKKGDRSKVHTHSYMATKFFRKNEVPERFRKKFVSNLSPADILELIQMTRLGNLIRTSHVAAIDSNGKVMGYVSYRISKNLLKDPRSLLHLEAIAEHYDSLFVEALSKGSWAHLETVMEEYKTRIEGGFGKNGTFVKNGLLMHRTPIPGYEYKDGHFREKAK